MGEERIIKIRVQKGENTIILWVRLWGGASNLIATDLDCVVLDAFYRRPKRNEVSGGKYNPEHMFVSEKSKNSKSRVYDVRNLPGKGSFNARVETYYSALEEEQERKRIREKLDRVYKQRESKMQSTLTTLENRRNEYTNYKRFKELGDLVMGNVHKIRKGDKWLHTEDYFGGEEPIEIELRPDRSPIANAKLYYDKYSKAKRGLKRIDFEIEQQKRNLRQIEEQSGYVDRYGDLDYLRKHSDSLLSKKKRSKDDGIPGIKYISHGFRIFIGRKDIENDILLRRYVKGNDFWFHVRDFPGAHVFVITDRGKSIPLETQLDAANCALFFSKGRTSAQGDVYYTQVKFLKRVQGKKKGLVIPTSEKNLYIKLDKQRINRLKKP